MSDLSPRQRLYQGRLVEGDIVPVETYNRVAKERRRMRYVMDSTVAPGKQYDTLWNIYLDIEEEEWKELGL